MGAMGKKRQRKARALEVVRPVSPDQMKLGYDLFLEKLAAAQEASEAGIGRTMPRPIIIEYDHGFEVKMSPTEVVELPPLLAAQAETCFNLNEKYFDFEIADAVAERSRALLALVEKLAGEVNNAMLTVAATMPYTEDFGKTSFLKRLAKLTHQQLAPPRDNLVSLSIHREIADEEFNRRLRAAMCGADRVRRADLVDPKGGKALSHRRMVVDAQQELAARGT